MSAIDKAIEALTEMHEDYVRAAAGDRVSDDLNFYIRGKRDAYKRAVWCARKARREETRWDRIKAVFRD